MLALCTLLMATISRNALFYFSALIFTLRGRCAPGKESRAWPCFHCYRLNFAERSELKRLSGICRSDSEPKLSVITINADLSTICCNWLLVKSLQALHISIHCLHPATVTPTHALHSFWVVEPKSLLFFSPNAWLPCSILPKASN